jgi:hypothetical protein
VLRLGHGMHGLMCCAEWWDAIKEEACCTDLPRSCH